MRGSSFMQNAPMMIEPPRGLDGSQLPDIMEASSDSQWFWEDPGDFWRWKDDMDQRREGGYMQWWPLLCRQGPAQPDAGQRQNSSMMPHCDLWHKVLIGFNLDSMKILRIPRISATATSPSGGIPAKPDAKTNFLRALFKSAPYCSNLEQLGFLSQISLIDSWPRCGYRVYHC